MYTIIKFILNSDSGGTSVCENLLDVYDIYFSFSCKIFPNIPSMCGFTRITLILGLTSFMDSTHIP